MTITHERLLSLLAYECETGVFVWKVSRGNGLKVGDAAGRIGQGYRLVRVDGRGYLAHRLAWFYVHGAWPDGEIDHINGDKLDNRIANLRDIRHRGNAENKRKARADNQTGFLGVHIKPANTKRPFVASIRVDGVLKHIGAFADPQAAHKAYVERKRQVHAACTI